MSSSAERRVELLRQRKVELLSLLEALPAAESSARDGKDDVEKAREESQQEDEGKDPAIAAATCDPVPIPPAARTGVGATA